MIRALIAWLCVYAAGFVLPALAQQKPATAPEVKIPSTIGNVIRGHIPADLPPIMRVKPG